MHVDIKYDHSPSARLKAITDIRDYLGPEKYDTLAPEMAKVSDCHSFAMYCALGGIRGWPVKVWYEHFHGQGTWKEPS